MSSRKLIAGSSHASRRTDAGRQSYHGRCPTVPAPKNWILGSADWKGRFSGKKYRSPKSLRSTRGDAAFFHAFPERAGYQFARKGIGIIVIVRFLPVIYLRVWRRKSCALCSFFAKIWLVYRLDGGERERESGETFGKKLTTGRLLLLLANDIRCSSRLELSRII